MGQVENYVTVDIVAQTANPSRIGFGLPLIASYHANFPERVREYNSVAALVTDGFAVESPTYRMAAQMYAQSPRVPKFLVGRRALAAQHLVVLSPTSTAVGTIYRLKVKAPNGLEQSISYTTPGAATAASICAALKILIDALPSGQGLSPTNLVATVVGSTLELKSLAANGKWFAYGGMNAALSFEDQTPDPGIATDLAAIYVERSDWFGLLLDGTSKAVIVAAAGWANTNKKLLGYQTLDTAVIATTYALGGADVMNTLRDSVSIFAVGAFAQHGNDHAQASWFGRMLPTSPGSETWKFKQLNNTTILTIDSGQYANIASKYGNAYVSGIGSLPLTTEGWTHGHEFIDVVRFIEWEKQELQLAVAIMLHNAEKLPYTNASVQTIANVIRGTLERGEVAGGFDAEFPYTIDFPLVEDMSAADRAARKYGNFSFLHRLAGAIHFVDGMRGTFTV